MTEDPRDNTPPGEDTDMDLDADDSYHDEISLSELEGDSSGGFGISGQDYPLVEEAEEPPPAPAAEDAAADELDDELSLDELDEDAASLFEVYAAPASPAAEHDAGDSSGEVYEVQAEPGPPSPPPAPAAAPPARPPASAGSAESDSIRRLHGVEVEVIATLGTTRMQIRDILGLQVGSVVELHRMVGEPVDVTLNGRLIARGEVVVVDEKFAIRVHEIAGNGE